MTDAAPNRDAAVPWEFVQDDTDERRGVARVLNARNELVCETSPLNADVIVCAVNYLTVTSGVGDEEEAVRRTFAKWGMA